MARKPSHANDNWPPPLWKVVLAVLFLAVRATEAHSAALPRLRMNDRGGNVLAYLETAASDAREGRLNVIAGDCWSACVIAAFARPGNVCVAPDARFHIHAARDPGLTTTAPIRGPGLYPPHVQAWIDAQGGTPREGWLVMPAEEAQALGLRPCVPAIDARSTASHGPRASRVRP